MAKKFFIPAVAPRRDAVHLGSIVPNIRQPHQDAFSSTKFPVKIGGPDILLQEQDSLGRLFLTSNNSSISAQLTNLLSASYEGQNVNMNMLSKCMTKLYELSQPKALFNRICSGDDDAKEWFQNEIENGTKALYFITAYYTVVDATIGRVNQESRMESFDAKIPVNDIVTATTGVAVPGIDLDAGISAKHGRGGLDTEIIKAPGERIFAFCYRKITFKFFLRRDIKHARMQSDNCWVMASENRGEDDEDEVVEANLDDEVDENDEDEEIAPGEVFSV
ncbi:hypothetical protein N5P37_011233 [Trichoderma harzianum]|uniref:Uncharacterized protein n=1 Tax=Trichoderma harzianum CBS 226.95 TaxID=983964 RepID=A0A2T3ZW30_TRIHA|nr:hypothetical protein M431DRAFT_513245 [Trichoderma harzianum CBS 226.95]KAK0756318.1 hypothetical protein N5P37_011233 [Trichoderma harzianum]PKK54622.1 hypothetical protein CI102_895 [Trichoderma harzianum]PTB48933.1 hypothetical protein M431DRAFT_513245 [Trichoderma harzianum CBS 226.95]